MIDPSIIGQPRPAPPMVFEMGDGTKIFFPQVVVAQIADSVIANVTARIAHFVTCEILGALEEAGTVPKGTLQKYEEPVPSEQKGDESSLPT